MVMAVCDGLFVYYNEARRLTQGGLRYQLKRGRRWWCCARVHQPDGSGAWTARSLGNAKASDRGEARGDRLPADGNKTRVRRTSRWWSQFFSCRFLWNATNRQKQTTG
jgi:hypothetical protein